ncbi:MAG: biopolymer transporter ExbD [Flavobacteriales bacterium]|nr:biopolymer transporter ExbD [Flavobacteriales bacterium]
MIRRKEDILTEEVHSRDQRVKKKDVEIDMNPMVDLAFLLLTFFMLTTTFATPQAMEIVMPVKPDEEAVEKEQAVKESKTLTIILHDEDEIYWYQGITDPEIEKTDYSPEGIRDLLIKKDQEIEDIVVLIKPSEASTYKNLVDILDEMHITAIQRYAIVDITDDDLALIMDLDNG